MVLAAAGSARCRPSCAHAFTHARSFHIASPTGAWHRVGSADSMRVLLNDMQHAPGCQCHGCGIGASQAPGSRSYGVVADGQPDYAFEMAASSIRYGRGVTAEVGMDMQNLGCRNVMLITDKNMAKLPVVQLVRESLDRAGRDVAYFDEVAVEPTGTSFQAAIDFAREKRCDAFISVGGGSVMDTAKAANLFATFPDHELLDFVNAPVGKGLPVPGALRPHIAIPTTAGTGSETTGQAIFDYEPLK
jgi:hydroxyacid-oxoacid transhydrogenase